MYEQVTDDIFFYMLYAAVATLSMTACAYLLWRRGNAFAAEVTSPARLRRWTAAFFAAMTMSHVWYLPTLFITTADELRQANLAGGLLDSVTIFPLAAVVVLTMLQDRRRQLWPVCMMTAPLVAGLSWCLANDTDSLMPVLRMYLLLAGVAFIIYMVRAVRQYGRWLRDNYADLEHKEVWQSFVVLAAILLMFGFYATGLGGITYEYIIQLSGMVLTCYLLWRVETLSDLSDVSATTALQPEPAAQEEETVSTAPPQDDDSTPMAPDNTSPLLQEHCIDVQLYLQHNLTLQQLANAIGINRYYLSQYFSRRGTTYNAYINGLRISHFVGLYREATASHRPFTTKQLAHESGYRSYSTFSLAFKQHMGQNVTAWMHEQESK